MSIIINFFIVFAFLILYLIIGTVFTALIWKQLKHCGAEHPTPYISFWPFILILFILDYAVLAMKWLSDKLQKGSNSGDAENKELNVCGN